MRGPAAAASGGATLEWARSVAGSPRAPRVEAQPWTIAPTLGWFAVALVAVLIARDGGIDALTDLVTRAPTVPVAAGPSFTASPVERIDEAEPALPPRPDLTPSPRAGAGFPASVPGKTIEDACADPVGATTGCKQWAMDGFYRALAAGEAGTASVPVRVSFYGDSVSASDALPGRLRARLQDVFGDGGPGFVHAIQPHRFNHNEAVDRKSSGSWQTWGVSLAPVADDLYGVGNATTEGAGRIKLKTRTSSGKLARVELYYLAQPRGGSVDLKVDGKVAATIDTAATRKESRFESLAFADGSHEIELTVTDGRVRLFGFALERAAGIVVDNMALVSCTARNMLNNLADHWKGQLAHRAPDLVVIMLGTNEAQWLVGSKAMTEYERHWEQLLTPVRAGRPRGACLVMSPLDQAETRDGKLVPRQVGRMVAAQRKAAQAMGCAFWDTYTWMGGTGSAIKWNRRGLLGSDFVHMSRKGTARVADGLADALFNGYKAYKAR